MCSSDLVGRYLRCAVTPTNPYGTATANSAATTDVPAVPLLLSTAYGSNAVYVFTIAPDDRVAVNAPPMLAVGSGPWFLDVAPDGRTLYATNSASNTVSQVRISPGGVLTALTPATLATQTTPYGITNVKAPDVWSATRGRGAVVAVQMARLTGQRVPFFTALGRDRCGAEAAERLDALGLELHVAWRDAPTRRGITFIDASGERTIKIGRAHV
mgnify:CR=1 FL=1